MRLAVLRYISLACVIGLCLTNPGVSADDAPSSLVIRRSSRTGLVTYLTGRDGDPIVVQSQPGRTTAGPDDFLRQHGPHLGITDPAGQLVLRAERTDSIGHILNTYDQVHRGVPVFSGELRLHRNADEAFTAANGRIYPIPPNFPVEPALSAETAAQLAQGMAQSSQTEVVKSELVIVDPGWYGDPSIGPHLAYYITLADSIAADDEAFFIDAHRETILDRWATVCHAQDRAIHLHNSLPGEPLPGPLMRAEGGPQAGIFDVDAAYDYLGDTYFYFSNAFGRDSYDDAGSTLRATVNSNTINCPNAGWRPSLEQMIFCPGVVSDDLVAHELVHGLTQFTSNLIYQNQPGQLNESFSDVFGELVDLFNGDAAFPGPPGGPPFWPTHPTGPGFDTPNNTRSTCSLNPSYIDGYRWLFGENATGFGGDVRDMWNPTCLGDPDRVSSPLQTCLLQDNGGVHHGSGIPNHAFAMLTDGKTFNGFTVNGIGPIKAGAVWYRALTIYLTVAADFEDAYFAFNLAAADLIGTTPNDPRTGLPSSSVFTAADATEVDNALLAVEMNLPGACGESVPVLDSTPPARCSNRTTIFLDDFEAGINGWTVSNSGPTTPYDWGQTIDPLPWVRPGTAWFCSTPMIGLCEGFSFNTGADLCFNAHLIEGEGTYRFNNVNATQDGFSDCLAGGQTAIDKDVWFCWTANCTGTVTFETCGLTSVDTKIAVYDGCTCPATTLLACDDDTCGLQSSITFAAVDNASYLLRIGTSPGAPGGNAQFRISSTPSCGEAAVHTLISPPILMPPLLRFPELSFTHYSETEPKWDGGHLLLRVNAGPWQTVPAAAFRFNAYNTTLFAESQSNTNPNAGQLAFSGVGGQWGTSIVDLQTFVAAGDMLEIRFDLSKDSCFGITGWYMDDVEVYHCATGMDCNGNGTVDEVDRALGPHRNAIVAQPPNHSSGNPSDLDPSGLGITAMADNFIVLRSRTIEKVRLWGGYFPNNPVPADSFTINIRADNAGAPGPIITTRAGLPAVRLPTGGTFSTSNLDEYEYEVTLSTPINLTPGTYFAEILNDTTGSPESFIWQRALVGHILGAYGALEAPGVSWIHDPLVNMSFELLGPVVGRSPGDINADGTVDTGDIGGFVDILLLGTTDADAFCAADINADIAIDGDDIAGFVSCLLVGACP